MTTMKEIEALGLAPHAEAFAKAVVAVGGDLPANAGAVHEMYADFRNDLHGTFQHLMAASLVEQVDPQKLFVQRGRFVEGCLPHGGDPRSTVLDAMLKVMFGLDPRTTFRADMDGAIRSGGGILPIVDEGGILKVLLGEDGEKFHLGKKKVLGGQLADVDRGDTWVCASREVSKEELGDYRFERDRAWKLHTPLAWRDTDGRMEYPIMGDFFIYPVEPDELRDIEKVFQAHTTRRGGKGEIVKIHAYTAEELLRLIRDGQIAFPEGCEAFLLLAMVMAEFPIAAYETKQGFGPKLVREVPFLAWSVAREKVWKEFQAILKTVDGDYSRLPLDIII